MQRDKAIRDLVRHGHDRVRAPGQRSFEPPYDRQPESRRISIEARVQLVRVVHESCAVAAGEDERSRQRVEIVRVHERRSRLLRRPTQQ